MPWPNLWSSSTTTDEKKEPSPIRNLDEVTSSILGSVVSSDPSTSATSSTTLAAFTKPETIVTAVALTAASLGVVSVYRTYLRRIPEAINIQPHYFRKRSVFGTVTRVGDGDNFRIYHTPGGILGGWGWFPGRRVPKEPRLLKGNTIHVRLAGIDAPELAHFGRPSQPYSQEALDWLTSYILHRRVRAYVYRQDQYSRVVATAYVRRGLFRRDIGLQMIKAGLATVYEAKTGAEFGKGLEQKYRNAEWWAKTKKIGMWAGNKDEFESPRQYKSKYAGTGNTPDGKK